MTTHRPTGCSSAALKALLVAGAVLLAGSLFAPSAGAATFAATASVDLHTQFVGDTGKDFTFTVTNTGTTDNIAAVLISRPSSKWAITECPQGPAGWTVTAAKTVSDVKCRYTSAAGPADDIPPSGSSSSFVVRANSVPGAADATGNWVVWASKDGSWSSSSITSATPAGAGLGTTAHVWEITDAVVAGSAATPDTACPSPNKTAPAASTTVIVVCGKSHANTALTPAPADSTLGGTFIQTAGTFASAPVAAASPSPVVLGSWTGTTVTASGGAGKTVEATTGSSATATSPLTTLTGYTAIQANSAPALAGIEATALGYTENGPAAVTSTITVADADSPNLTGATVQISANFVAGQDVLALPSPPPGITPTFSGDTLTLSGSASLAAYQTALRGVTYANSSDDPSTATRTVSFQVNDGAPANNLSNVVSRDINVTRVNDAPVGVGDAFDALGNTRLLVGLAGTGPRFETAGSVLTNDTDVDTPHGNLDALPETRSSTNCGGCNNVVINADGSFTYDPPAGFTGNDTFTYTVRDNDPGDAPSPAQTATGTVTITVQGPVVWYVDSTPEAGQTGNTGRSHSPFTSTTSLQPTDGSVDDVNEIIFVYEGTYTAANGLALQAGQKLLGQPHGLTVDPAGSLPSRNLVAAGGTNPELRATGTTQAAIGLANDVEIQRVNISNSSATNGCTACIGVRGTAVTTATIGANTQISGNSGIGFQLLTAAGGNITVGSQISGNGGLAVSVANRSGGTVQFTGQVSSTAGGVSLSSNAGATINLSAGNMSLATGTGTAFAVSGGGVVNVSGPNNSLSTTTGTTVEITGASSNNITIDATITQNGATSSGKAVSVTGHTGGAISFPKAVSSTNGAGVSLTTNASTTVTFSSAITLSGANATFVATGTGTLNASNAANVVGNTTPATGPGVRVENTTLGSTLRFTKVAVSGGTNGIVMNNTGTSFGLNVSGAGTTDGSGGTIDNTTGAGVVLTNTRFTTLKNMVIGDNAATAGQTPNATNNIGGDGIDMVNADDANFDNLKIARTGGHGIDGTQVRNLVLSNSEILNAGDADNEHAFAFNDFSGVPPTENNLEGTVIITNTVFDAFVQDGINVENFAGTLNMTVTGSTFANNTSTLCGGSTCGETGLLARSDGNSVINLTVNGGTLFNGIDGNGLFMISEGSSATASTLNVTNTTIQNSKAIGIVLFGGTGDHTSTIPSKLNFTVGGSVSVTGSTATAISIQPNGKSTMRGTVTGVTVTGSQIGRGIEVLSDDVSTSVIAITNNTISNTAFNGIFANNGDSGKLDIHIRNNNVSAPLDVSPASGLAVHGIEVNPLAEATTTCLDIKDNVSAGNAASGGAGYRTRQRDPAVFKLERLTGSTTSAANIAAFLQAQNTSGTGSATVDSGYTAVADGACEDV